MWDKLDNFEVVNKEFFENMENFLVEKMDVFYE